MKWLTCVLMLLTVPAFADRVYVLDGDRLLLVDTETKTATPLPFIRVDGGGGGPDNPPPVNPSSAFGKKVKAAADALKDQSNRERLAATFEFLSSAVSGDRLKITEAAAFARRSAAGALGSSAAKWKPVTDLIDGEVARLVQDGAWNKAAAVKLFNEVRDAIDAGASDQANAGRGRRSGVIKDFINRAPRNIDLERWLQLLTMLLDFLKLIGVLS